MFLGHFAIGVAAKPWAPTMPIWILFLAPQFMDVLFLALFPFGIEGVHPEGNLDVYGQFRGNILYTHSLVGALVIAAVAYGIGRRFWKTSANGWWLAGLSFSHWPVDLIVHQPDMPILPGNLGSLPLLGLGGWNFPVAILTIEILMAVVGLALYLRWAVKEKPSARWYVGPAVIFLLFAIQAVGALSQLP